MENGVAILWKNYLQLFAKSTCKKQTKYNNGNCLGITLTEKEHFMHKMPKENKLNKNIELGINKDNLSEYTPNDFSFKMLKPYNSQHKKGNDCKKTFNEECCEWYNKMVHP